MELTQIFSDLGLQKRHLDSNKLEPTVQSSLSSLRVVDLDFEGKAFLLDAEAALAWNAMILESLKIGLQLRPYSGFRSMQYQQQLIKKHLANGRPLDDILNHIAIPGYSEHHTGCAVDVYVNTHAKLEEEFENTAEFKWLSQNAERFGFSLSYPRNNTKGIAYEPWHWFYKKGFANSYKFRPGQDWRPIAATFVRKMVFEMSEVKMPFDPNWQIDHLCYRVESEDQYQLFKSFFATEGKLLIESEVNGRLISTFKLSQPLLVNQHSIDLIELPAPKKSKPQIEGFEHIEIVCHEAFEKIQNSFSVLKFDVSGLKKSINAELELKLNSGSIKFHHQSLETVIAAEIEMKN